MKHFKKILLYDSGHGSGTVALKRASDLALRNKAQLTVAGVIEDLQMTRRQSAASIQQNSAPWSCGSESGN